MLARTLIRSAATLCRRRVTARLLLLNCPSSSVLYNGHARHIATSPPQLNVSDVSLQKYHELSDMTMDTLLESLESLLDSLGNPDFEVEYHSGVLTLKLGEKGTYVINKQPPNKQIWLSSPFSGPKRYDYMPSKDDWQYSRDGRTMGDLLNDELGRVLERRVDLGIREISKQL